MKKDYRYVKEQYINMWLPILVGMTLLEGFILFAGDNSDFTGTEYFAFSIGFFVPFIITMYSLYYIRRRKKFMQSDKKYSGRIVGCGAYYATKGYGSRFYLQIEFEKKGKKIVIESMGYPNSPNSTLSSRDCTVYELEGEYYPANYTLAKKGQKRLEIPTTKRKH